MAVMTTGGPPFGNKNASKSRPWAEAIDRALKQAKAEPKKGRATLDKLAVALIDRAADGDMAAMKEVGDRLDGKPAQQTEITGLNGGPVEIETSERPKLTREEWLAAHGMGIAARQSD